MARLLLKAKHIEVLEIVYREAKAKEVTDLRESSYFLLASTYKEEAEKLIEEAEKAMQEKDYKLARTNYEKEGLYRENIASLKRDRFEWEFGVDVGNILPIYKTEEAKKEYEFFLTNFLGTIGDR